MNSTMRNVDGVRRSAPSVAVLGLQPPEAVALNLCSVVMAVRDHGPVVGVTSTPGTRIASLPCGPYMPSEHASLQAGLRAVVEQQTGIRLGGSLPLCTFGEGVSRASSDLVAPSSSPAQLPVVSLSYLALLAPEQVEDRAGLVWQSWYEIFPWEDWRDGKPRCLAEAIEPHLAAWAGAAGESVRTASMLDRSQRIRIAFGADGAGWDEEKIVERYDLLRESGLVGERGEGLGVALWHPVLGLHTRVLACAIADLRRSIKTRPDIFELMPELFTLFELQKAVEGILGPNLHKQNFRRLVEGAGLVEPTGEMKTRTGGRPAKLFRFRREVLLERPAPGVRVTAPPSRAQ